MSEFNEDAFLEHMRLHRNESKKDWAEWGWTARQSEIDQLKAQLEVKHSAPNHKTQFEDMIRQSPDFATLLNIHGERLFIKRGLSYDILAMRSAYWTWLWVHTLYKDVSETCSEMVDEIEDLEAEIEKLKAEKAGFKNLVKSLRSEFDLNGGSDQVERQIELLEEAVRGQAKQQQPKLGKTAIGDCLHFGTTMFHDGKATCFDCDAVVNHERKVIGVMEVKALRGTNDHRD